MKKFAFPLARVLDWRQTQAQIEESKLAQMYSELRAIEMQIGQLRAERAQAEAQILAAKSATGSELAALDSFKHASAAAESRLAAAAAVARQRAASQLQAVIQKKRDVKTLENLRERQQQAWNVEKGREIDREAGELHLLRPHPR